MNHRPDRCAAMSRCWTLNKIEKLRNFRQVGMWFLDPATSGFAGAAVSDGPGKRDDSRFECRALEAYTQLAGPLEPTPAENGGVTEGKPKAEEEEEESEKSEYDGDQEK